MSLFLRKILFAPFLLSFLLFLVTAMPGPAFSGEEGLKFAVVDINALLNDSAAGKSIQEQLEKKRSEFQEEFSKRETELRQVEKNIIDKKEKAPVEELEKEKRKFESGLLETKKLFRERRAALDRGLAEAMQELRKKIIQASAEIAEEEGYQAILTRESVVVVEKDFDITLDVLKKLDKKTKIIPLDIK
ncbi:MAG: OmpH family outer membrane protein [Rhodospirillales bacterium]|nr:OmpH family outer membrane protein [Alphaproteobacteria bacterium]USO03303.1 MAG: OmpH family outer membrane protein [Rhodospirillales bacterium]